MEELITRNYKCPHYEKCLNKAAKKDLVWFDCNNCRYCNEEVEYPASLLDLNGCLALLAVIFVPIIQNRTRSTQHMVDLFLELSGKEHISI